MRFIYVLLTTLLLVALFVVLASAQVAWRLVTVSYSGWEQLQGLQSSGLQIIHYRGDVLAALSSDEQIEQLRQSGFEVRVLDPAADPDSYYLAYPAPGETKVSGSGLEAVYPYAAGVYIVKAPRLAAEALSTQAVQIVKLPRSVTLDRRGHLASSQSDLAYSTAIQQMVDAVSSTLLIGHVCKLQDDDSQGYCNALGTRYSYATAQLGEAAQYLANQYTALGLTVTYDALLSGGLPITNVVAELPGVGPGRDHIYILCAHYDSIAGGSRSNPSSPAPGADDNASGSAAVLEAARILSQYRFDRTIRFIHFAGEEQGMVGSQHYALAAAQRGDLIDGVINLDMIGYESVPPNDHIVEVHAGTMPASGGLADAFISSIAEYDLQLVPQKLTSSSTDRSDHSSFWYRGYPAILGIEDYTGDFNQFNYHQTSDTLANLQPSMMVEYTRACVATLAWLAVDTQGLSSSLYLPYVARLP